MKGTIVLSHRETHRAKVLERVSVGVLTLRQASVLLGVSYRQARRRPPKHHSRRERRPRVGIMMQWDGSPHRWFGPEHPPCCLMSAIDDADGRLLGAVFVPHESCVGYLRLLDLVIRRHGKPLSVY